MLEVLELSAFLSLSEETSNENVGSLGQKPELLVMWRFSNVEILRNLTTDQFIVTKVLQNPVNLS